MKENFSQIIVDSNLQACLTFLRCQNFTVLSRNNFKEIIINPLQKMNYLEKYCLGAEKIVLFPNSSQYCIKIFLPNNMIGKINSVEKEISRYQQGKIYFKEQNFLLPNIKYASNIFLQEKVIPVLQAANFKEYHNLQAKDFIEEQYKQRRLYKLIQCNDIDKLITWYLNLGDLFFLKKVFNFFVEQNINDLTIVNLGYDKNNKSVMFDYSL